jgi:predicted nucleic acid-binding protein
MNVTQVFLDTAYIQALLNRSDGLHIQAKELLPELRKMKEILVTEAVLTEVGNTFSRNGRETAARYIESCYQATNITVVSVSAQLFSQALSWYIKHQDKEWGLTDCISMIVMQDRGIKTIFTADHHFEQAGFEIVLK